MTIGRRDNHVVFLFLRKARTEAELQRRSCSVGYPRLVALTHAALIGHGYRAHQPSEFHRMVEIGGGSCTLANVPALVRRHVPLSIRRAVQGLGVFQLDVKTRAGVLGERSTARQLS
jgi:hypothetical protein